MKKYLPIIIMMLVCICSAEASAMSGSIQITAPQDAEGSVVSYAKIAEREELEESRVAEWMEMDIEPEGNVQMDENGLARIEHLPEGIYQLQISGKNGYDFTRALVSIPMWDEEKKDMNYEISVFPKYTYTPVETEQDLSVLHTGDDSQIGVYITAGIISFIIVVIISCHNRFKCARMSE